MPLHDDFNDAADDWYSLEPGSFPAVPLPLLAVREPMPLTIGDTEGFRKRPDVIKAALLVVSQSRTARRFAALAAAEGYRIVVDAPSLSAAGREEVLGSTDHETKTIHLRGSDEPLRLALILGHELAHVSQIVQGGLDMNARRLHPLAGLRQLLAMEADARAQEFLIAAELAFRAKDEPEERLLFPQMLDVAAESIGASFARGIIGAAAPELRAGGDPAPFMTEIFRGFYGSPSLRAHYEDAMLRTLETLEKDHPGTLREKEFFTGDLPREELLARLSRHDRAYISALAVDLDDPNLLSVSVATQQRLAALEALRRQNPETAGGKSWQGDVYSIEKSPVAPLTEKRPGPPKPPVR